MSFFNKAISAMLDEQTHPGYPVGGLVDCDIVPQVFDLYERYHNLRESYWQVREQTEYPCPRPVSDPKQQEWWDGLVDEADAKAERYRLDLWLLRAKLMAMGVPENELPYPKHN